MIRFVAQGGDGAILGLGLSTGNLERLEQDEPIAFEQASEDGLAGLFIVAVEGSARVVVLLGELGPVSSTVLELSGSDIDELRNGGGIQRQLTGGRHGFSWALFVHGTTELHILEALSESGLVPAGVELDGWGEYVRDLEQHERRSSADARPLSGDPQHGHGLDGRPGPLWRRLAASPASWLFGLVLLGGLISLGIRVAQSRGDGSDGVTVPSRSSPAEMPASEPRRRAWVDAADVRVFGAVPGDAPCPLEVWVPEPLGSTPIAGGGTSRGREETARLQDGLLWMLDARLMDIAPEPGARVRGLTRVVRNEPLPDGWRDVQSYATLVVSELEDVTVLGSTGDVDVRTEPAIAGTRTTTTRVLDVKPGRVRARLLVWDYPAGAVLCASAPIEVQTPSLQLSSFESELGRVEDDVVLKARVETLVAAAREARSQLRRVRAFASRSETKLPRNE